MILDDIPLSIKSNFKLNEYNTDEFSEIDLKYKNDIDVKMITSIGIEYKREAFIIGDKGQIYIPDFQQNQEFILKTEKEIKYSYPFEINGFEYQIKEAIDQINNHKNESDLYPSYKSIRLMKLLFDIRMSWNMKFNFE